MQEGTKLLFWQVLVLDFRNFGIDVPTDQVIRGRKAAALLVLESFCFKQSSWQDQGARL